MINSDIIGSGDWLRFHRQMPLHKTIWQTRTRQCDAEESAVCCVTLYNAQIQSRPPEPALAITSRRLWIRFLSSIVSVLAAPGCVGRTHPRDVSETCRVHVSCHLSEQRSGQAAAERRCVSVFAELSDSSIYDQTYKGRLCAPSLGCYGQHVGEAFIPTSKGVSLIDKA